MIDFLNRLADESSCPSDCSVLSKKGTSLLDLGCGNGSMLFSLREEGWCGRALGVDYSPQSVQLARQVCLAKAEENTDDDDDDGDDDMPRPEVRFAEWDIMKGPYETVLRGEDTDTDAPPQPWDVVLDKGTFDAVSLSGEQTEDGRRVCEVYPERVLPLVRKGGLFLITSCNWTEEELTKWFAGSRVRGRSNDDARGLAQEEEGFVPAGRIEYRTFSFGGVKGQTISTLCFRKV
ncbi:hypothetical protein E4U54_000334 [Claviceps lovelessii]|nr:hypothetical protein E4U54_000334 [Claviceps lovelessii]